MPWGLGATTCCLLVVALAPMVATGVEASGAAGCTPCECGVALCEDGREYWPSVRWSDGPTLATSGQPFNVTATFAWTLHDNGTWAEAPGPHHAVALTWRQGNITHTIDGPLGPVPRNVTWRLHAPGPGETLHLTAAFSGRDGPGWQNETVITGVRPMPEGDLPRLTEPPGQGVPTPGILLPLLLAIIAGRSRAP